MFLINIKCYLFEPHKDFMVFFLNVFREFFIAFSIKKIFIENGFTIHVIQILNDSKMNI